jgi:Domain of unknown function (DUF5666)
VKIGKIILAMAGLVMMYVGVCGAQEPANPDTSGGTPQQAPQKGEGRGRGQGGPRPLFGKITSMNAGTLVITRQDGSTVVVKLTEQTEFRKDREPAKVMDFKLGDTVMVRGAENADHTVTASVVGARTDGPGGGGTREGGPGGGPGGAAMGTLGKDYVAGEIKSMDAPKLTVLRTDNVTQTLELNEETSLRRGRESITMADIKVGDHVIARGAVANGAFVPKGVMVMSTEQWQRMQQRAMENGAPTSSPAVAPPGAQPQE